MSLALDIDPGLVERADSAAKAMGKNLGDVVIAALEDLVRKQDVERAIATFRALSPSGKKSWRFNREEIYDRKVFSR